MTDDFEPSVASGLGQSAADVTPADIDTRRWLTIALLLNSALYLTAAFIAGLVLGNRFAWAFALASCGCCYLAPMVQLAAPQYRRIAIIFVGSSIGFGIAAGLALLFF